MRRPTSTPRPRRPGLALVAVLAQLTLIFMVWSLANRQCASTIGLEEAIRHRQGRQQGLLSALALGVSLLETGTPDPTMLVSDDTYECFVDAPLSGDRYTLTYVRTESDPEAEPPMSRWNVSAAPYDPVADLAVQGPISTFAIPEPEE